jgi:shikimate dehydrogenase
MSLTLGLLGSGISHSRMPLLQKYLAERSGVELSYQLLDKAEEELSDPINTIQQLRQQGFDGINVTHPFKQKIFSCAQRSVIAGHEAIGSYNTLKFVGEEIHGANTDYMGFIQSYRFVRGKKKAGNVFLAGAGGVGRAVAFALAELGCEQFTIYDLLTEQAESLAALLKNKGLNVHIADDANKAELILGADGLLNCTNLGMHNYPGTVFEAELIRSQQWAFDAIYTPLDTEFMEHCNEAGVQCISGFFLWLFQGLEAFRIFTGKEAQLDQDLIKTALNWFDLNTQHHLTDLLPEKNLLNIKK